MLTGAENDDRDDARAKVAALEAVVAKFLAAEIIPASRDGSQSGAWSMIRLDEDDEDWDDMDEPEDDDDA